MLDNTNLRNHIFSGSIRNIDIVIGFTNHRICFLDCPRNTYQNPQRTPVFIAAKVSHLACVAAASFSGHLSAPEMGGNGEWDDGS